MSKIVFLDIDGVLNCGFSEAYMPQHYVGIDDDKLQNLKHIIEATGAEIYLTSTWKHGWSKFPDAKALQDEFGDEIDRKFSAIGLSIVDKTCDDLWDRGNGIYRVLISSYPKPEGWVVLDDEYWPDFITYEIDKHLVKTEWNGAGLTKEKAELAIQILNNEIEMQYPPELFIHENDHIGKE